MWWKNENDDQDDKVEKLKTHENAEHDAHQ